MGHKSGNPRNLFAETTTTALSCSINCRTKSSNARKLVKSCFQAAPHGQVFNEANFPLKAYGLGNQWRVEQLVELTRFQRAPGQDEQLVVDRLAMHLVQQKEIQSIKGQLIKGKLQVNSSKLRSQHGQG